MAEQTREQINKYKGNVRKPNKWDCGNCYHWRDKGCQACQSEVTCCGCRTPLKKPNW